MVDDAVVDQGRGTGGKFRVGGAGGAVGVEQDVVMGVWGSAQSFCQQQCYGAAEAVAAHYDALAGVKLIKILQYEITQRPIGLVKTIVGFSNTAFEGHLMGVGVT